MDLILCLLAALSTMTHMVYTLKACKYEFLNKASTCLHTYYSNQGPSPCASEPDENFPIDFSISSIRPKVNIHVFPSK